MSSRLVGTIYTQSNSDFMENPYFENLADFFSCTHVDVWWIGLHVTQVRFWRPKGPHLERSHAVWQSPSSLDKKLRAFPNYRFFTFDGQKGVFLGQKNGVFDRV